MKRYNLDIQTGQGKIHSELMYVEGSGWMPLPVVIYADGMAKTLIIDEPDRGRKLEVLRQTIGESLMQTRLPAMQDLMMIRAKEGQEVNRIASEIMGAEVRGDVVVMKWEVLR